MKEFVHGIILNRQSFSETSAILSIFTYQNGVMNGFVKGAMTAKNLSLSQVGNSIFIKKTSRNDESLSTLHISPKFCFTAIFVDNHFTLQIFSLCLKLLLLLLPQNHCYKNLYAQTILLFSFLSEETSLEIKLSKYLIWELNLLKELGYSINLKSCIISKSIFPYYISPKTGNSVSYDVGKSYGEKLFIIPKFFLNELHFPSKVELKNASQITHFFLNKNFPHISHSIWKNRYKLITNLLSVN